MELFSFNQWMALIRSLLTWIGGILIAKGVLSQEIFNSSLGAIMTLAGVAWSYLTHAPLPPADPPPPVPPVSK